MLRGAVRTGRHYLKTKYDEATVITRRVPLWRTAPFERENPLQYVPPPRRIVPIPKKRLTPRRGPDRCPDYLAWIRTLDCVVCSRVADGSPAAEAAHTNALGPRGLSQKSSDFSAIPLCAGHHRENPDSYHRLGEQQFMRVHQIDLTGLVRSLNQGWSRHENSAVQGQLQDP